MVTESVRAQRHGDHSFRAADATYLRGGLDRQGRLDQHHAVQARIPLEPLLQGPIVGCPDELVGQSRLRERRRQQAVVVTEDQARVRVIADRLRDQQTRVGSGRPFRREGIIGSAPERMLVAPYRASRMGATAAPRLDQSLPARTQVRRERRRARPLVKRAPVDEGTGG